MIIHTPEIIHEAGRVRAQARVETRSADYDLPTTLWFSFPESYQDYLSGSSNAFAASLLVLAAYLGETLEVRGRVSPRLAYGLLEYRNVYHSWLPRLFQPVELKFGSLEALPDAQSQGKVALAFSGGVDSLYTLWAHLPDNQPVPSAVLTHALFVHGFDFRLSRGEAYQRFYQHYTQALAGLGIQLLTASTNALLFYQFVMKWEYAHGGPLVGTGLCLEKLIGRFYISSAYKYTQTTPTGTSSLLDHWLSTETTEVIHFGGAKNKYGKLQTHGDWPVAHELLHVCVNLDKEGMQNCGVCRKCELTRLRLEVLGVLERFKTFTRPFSYRDLLRMVLVEDPSPDTEFHIAREAFQARRLDIALPILILSLLHTLQCWLSDLLNALLSKERMYRLKRRVYAERIESDPLN
ncbi:MAG: hypothetical protein PHS96_14750 [Anaerolineales bacterium]|nr:hypothetical protein [Anaerolineales bacterium]